MATLPSIGKLNRLAASLGKLGFDLPESARPLADLTQAVLQAGAGAELDGFLDDIEHMSLAPKDVPRRLTAAAQAVVVRKARETLMGDARKKLDKAALNWAARHESEIVGVVRPTFDDAAAALTVAVEHLDGIVNGDQAIDAGVEEHWRARVHAERTLKQVHLVRKEWCIIVNSELVHASPAWWLASADTTEDLTRAGEILGRSDHFRVADLVTAGFALRMNVTVEALALVARAAAGSQALREAELASDPAVVAHNQRVRRWGEALQETTVR